MCIFISLLFTPDLATEQLEKSREIIKRLKAEKQQAVSELEGQLREREDVMEQEKESLVQEVSRGKSAAISLMQVCCKSFCFTFFSVNKNLIPFFDINEV